MATILLIFQIGKILFEVAPELYKAFMDILAAVKATPETGNVTTEMAVKSTAKAIIPVLDEATAAQVQAAIDSYEKGAAEYAAQFGANP